jgi:hypothetical protein
VLGELGLGLSFSLGGGAEREKEGQGKDATHGGNDSAAGQCSVLKGEKWCAVVKIVYECLSLPKERLMLPGKTRGSSSPGSEWRAKARTNAKASANAGPSTTRYAQDDKALGC